MSYYLIKTQSLSMVLVAGKTAAVYIVFWTALPGCLSNSMRLRISGAFRLLLGGLSNSMGTLRTARPGSVALVSAVVLAQAAVLLEATLPVAVPQWAVLRRAVP